MEQKEKLAEIKELVKKGEIKQYKLEEYIFENLFSSDAEKFKKAIETTENLRAEIFEEDLAVTLDKTKDYDKFHDECKQKKSKDFINTAKLKKGEIVKGTELKIGTAKIPLSIAGPVKIKLSNIEILNQFSSQTSTNFDIDS